ncbi:MAG TPA: RNA polymerase sigma factor [Opitutaceae bacterium]|nr:RNA polymerase sigma factor [Opitutaceae bacterium]
MPADSAQDLALMADLVAGRDSALDEIMERWEGPLRSFAHRYLLNGTDTDEVVEETFVRVYHKRADFVPGSNFSAWIFTIAANLCRHRLRWRRRHPSESIDIPDEDGAPGLGSTLPARGADPAVAAEGNERVAALRAAVDTLPHDQRTVFLLHSYEGLSYREIATAVGCSERGVETRLYRARQTLREKLTALLALSPA